LKHNVYKWLEASPSQMNHSIQYCHIIYYNKMFAMLVLGLSAWDDTFFMASLAQLVSFPAKGLIRDLSAQQTHWALCPKSHLLTKWWLQSRLTSRLHKTGHKQCIITSNCQLSCQLSAWEIKKMFQINQYLPKMHHVQAW